MGKELEGVPKSNSAETWFIEFVEENVTEAEATNFRASLSLSKEQMMDRLSDLMAKHELYKVDRSKASPRIRKAWEIMDNFIAGKAEYLRDKDITPIIYGSTTFDDPAYLDFDLALVGINDRIEVETDIDSWVGELAASWKQIGTEGHVNYINLEKLERYAKAIQENELEYVQEEDFDIFTYLFYGSSVLIGNYAYSSKEEENRYKEKYLEIIKQSPSLLAYTLFNLEQSLIERETRRAGVGDHQTGEGKYKQRFMAEKFNIHLPPNAHFE